MQIFGEKDRGGSFREGEQRLVEVDKREDKDEPASEGGEDARQGDKLPPESQQILRGAQKMQFS